MDQNKVREFIFKNLAAYSEFCENEKLDSTSYESAIEFIHHSRRTKQYNK